MLVKANDLNHIFTAGGVKTYLQNKAVFWHLNSHVVIGIFMWFSALRIFNISRCSSYVLVRHFSSPRTWIQWTLILIWCSSYLHALLARALIHSEQICSYSGPSNQEQDKTFCLCSFACVIHSSGKPSLVSLWFCGRRLPLVLRNTSYLNYLVDWETWGSASLI